jgi:uncharacterized repeat protein (TIGR01451 family)
MNKLAVFRLAILLTAFVFSPLTLSAEAPARVQALATGSWELVDAPTPASMYGLDMLDATEGWAGGMAGFVFHYINGMWGGFPTDFVSAINAIDVLSPTSGWGVTWQGQFIRYNGSSWVVHSDQDEILDDIYMVSENDGWAVGGGGVILRYNGSSWAPVYSPATRQLKGVDMLDANYGWAVGLGGFAVQWNGSSWLGGSLDPAAQLVDVDVLTTTDVWAVGMNGLIYHYDGAAWHGAPSPTTNGLESVFMVSASNGWAVGEGGTILHYDGQSWQIVASPTTNDLSAVQFTDPLNGWAVGKNGAIVHYVPAPANLGASRKSVDRRHAIPGEVITYTIHVENSGELVAPGVIVTDAIPVGANYVPGSATTTRGTIQEPDPLVVSIGDLEAGGEVTITLQATAQDLGQACWMVINRAIVASGGTQLTRIASTTFGDCYQAYLPIILKHR